MDPQLFFGVRGVGARPATQARWSRPVRERAAHARGTPGVHGARRDAGSFLEEPRDPLAPVLHDQESHLDPSTARLDDGSDPGHSDRRGDETPLGLRPRPTNRIAFARLSFRACSDAWTDRLGRRVEPSRDDDTRSHTTTAHRRTRRASRRSRTELTGCGSCTSSTRMNDAAERCSPRISFVRSSGWGRRSACSSSASLQDRTHCVSTPRRLRPRGRGVRTTSGPWGDSGGRSPDGGPTSFSLTEATRSRSSRPRPWVRCLG